MSILINRNLNINGLAVCSTNGQINNYDPDAGTYHVFTGNNQILTGCEQSKGKLMVIKNVSDSDLTIKNNSTDSTTYNRFTLGSDSDLILTTNQAALFSYDNYTSSWQLIGAVGSSGEGGGGPYAPLVSGKVPYANLPVALMGTYYYNAADYGILPANADNTEALQDLIDLIAATHKNSVIYFPEEGPYLFTGALQDTGRRNAQILFPSVPISEVQYTITLKGYQKPTFSPQVSSDVPLPSGTILKTTLATGGGTNPSFLGGKGPIGGQYFECSYMCPGLDNVIIQTVENPMITAVNFDSFTNTNITGNVVIVAGEGIGVFNLAEPTTATSFAYIQPHYSSGVDQRIEGCLSILGFYNGIRVGENAVIDVIGVYGCKNPIVFDFSHGTSIIRKLNLGWCGTHLTFTAAHATHIYEMSTERWVPGQGGASSQWFDFIADVADPDNVAVGEVTYFTGVAGVGHQGGLFTKIGGVNFYTRELGEFAGGGGSTPEDAILHDTFTDVNGTLLTDHTMEVGSGWTRFSGGGTNQMSILNGKAISYLDGSNAYGYTSDAGEADVTITAIGAFGVAGNNHYVQIVARLSNSTNYFYVSARGDGDLNIYKVEAGSATVLANAMTTFSTGLPFDIEVTVLGNNISATINGQVLGATSSFNNTSTSHGIMMYQGNTGVNTIEDFLVVPA